MEQTYRQQEKEIRVLLGRIKQKTRGFVMQTKDPYFEDLQKVKADLTEIDAFLSDKYLKSKK
jgi:CHASE3 domain sensor protein